MITINTTIICGGNYTDINFNVEYETVILESGNERIAYASMQRENDPFILQKQAELIAAKELYYSDKDLDALKAAKEAEILYQQKYAAHKGYRFYMYCDYDLCFETSLTHAELKATMDYLVPRKNTAVFDFTITDATDEAGNHFNKAEIFSNRIAESEMSVFAKYAGSEAVVEIFKGFEDLNDFIVN